jgi:dihydrofolate synthase/folylpolyglutamate synthase
MVLRTLADAARYLEGLINLERTRDFDYERLGLGRIRALLHAVGRPEAGLPCIHIAGSKGKGSVALAAERLLIAASQHVGTYTSPHLVSWPERFRIAGQPVVEDQLVAELRGLQPAVEQLRKDPELRPSFFDVSTALAFLLFRSAAVDAGVIEVGLGGRLDSTNIVQSRVSVLTSVQLEHTDKLGSTLEEIALEKAGILRPGVPLLHGTLPPAAAGPVMARAVAEDVRVEEVKPRDVVQSEAGLRFRLADGREIASPVLGRHQAGNLALAVRAAEHFLGRTLAREELRSLEALRLPARIERIGDVIVDCAHTPDSARALRETLQEIWPERDWTLVVSISRDKDAAGILRELAPATRALIITRAERVRSADPEALVPLANAEGIEKVDTSPDPHSAFAHALALRAAGELLVLTGSIYFAGEIRARFR